MTAPNWLQEAEEIGNQKPTTRAQWIKRIAVALESAHLKGWKIGFEQGAAELKGAREREIVLPLSEQQLLDVQSVLSTAVHQIDPTSPQFAASLRKILSKTWLVLRKHRAAQKKKAKK